MLILYVALKYDYGNPANGYSFEHNNFYDSLVRMGHDILYFDLGKFQDAASNHRLNQRLLEVVRTYRPDVMFTIPFREELDKSVVSYITERTTTRTLAWFCDDHWRFDSYTRLWAPCFGWSITTAHSALTKYAAIGHHNVIPSQWACNSFLYGPAGHPMQYDVTFVGQPHGDRRRWIKALRKAGIKVQTWGSGWKSGRLQLEEMTKVFSTSRINLNLSNASSPEVAAPAAAAHGFRNEGLLRLTTPMRRILETWDVPLHGLPTLPQQIKGRNFEIPGCGGFILTHRAEDLDRYYEDGREIVCFETVHEMIEKIHYYLSHDAERAAIAAAGYKRTLREHTYVHRFTDVFKHLQLPVPDPTAILSTPPKPGEVSEIS